MGLTIGLLTKAVYSLAVLTLFFIQITLNAGQEGHKYPYDASFDPNDETPHSALIRGLHSLCSTWLLARPLKIQKEKYTDKFGKPSLLKALASLSQPVEVHHHFIGLTGNPGEHKAVIVEMYPAGRGLIKVHSRTAILPGYSQHVKAAAEELGIDLDRAARGDIAPKELHKLHLVIDFFSEKGIEERSKLKQMAVEIAKEQDKRRHWPKEFLDTLGPIANLYIEQASYTLYFKIDEKFDPLMPHRGLPLTPLPIETFRIIEARYSFPLRKEEVERAIDTDTLDNPNAPVKSFILRGGWLNLEKDRITGLAQVKGYSEFSSSGDPAIFEDMLIPDLPSVPEEKILKMEDVPSGRRQPRGPVFLERPFIIVRDPEKPGEYRGIGALKEPGLWSIVPSENHKHYADIMIGNLMVLFDPEMGDNWNFHAVNFTTYNDRRGQRMYHPLSFGAEKGLSTHFTHYGEQGEERVNWTRLRTKLPGLMRFFVFQLGEVRQLAGHANYSVVVDFLKQVESAIPSQAGIRAQVEWEPSQTGKQFNFVVNLRTEGVGALALYRASTDGELNDDPIWEDDLSTRKEVHDIETLRFSINRCSSNCNLSCSDHNGRSFILKVFGKQKLGQAIELIPINVGVCNPDNVQTLEAGDREAS